MHPQVWIKVNAQVDAGIAGIVKALNAFPELQTIESCEGQTDGLWVCFSYGGERSWRAIAEFALGFFAPKLFERVGDAVQIALRPTVSGEVIADLTIRPEGLESVQKAINTIADELIRDRNLACSDGKSGTCL